MELTSISPFTGPSLRVWQNPDSLLIMELSDGTSAYNSEFVQKLGFQPSLIRKFMSFKGRVRTQVARKLADRLITYMRSAEQNTASVTTRSKQPTPSRQEPLSDIVVAAVEWKVLRRTDELEEKIAELVRLINDVTRHITTCNLPDNQRALTDIERAQLIAVLETVLHLLKAPMVEKGLIKKATEMLKHAAARAVEKQVEEAFAFAAGFAAGKLSHLLGSI
jgi:hypothetical protein